jgi:hypothetical protein
LPASSSRMVVLLLTTTSRRSPPFAWCCVSGKAFISSSRPSLARRPVLGRTAASPTSFPLEEPSHDKSPSRTTSPGSDWYVGPSALLGRRYRCTGRSESPRHAETTADGHASGRPGKSLNAGLTSRATITSPSSSTLPHARLNPRHSSTLYDAHNPRLRLGRGKLGKHSDRLRQAQTTRGRRPSVPEETVQPSHAAASPTRHRDSASLHPDGQRRTTRHASCRACNSFVFPLVPLPLRL